MSTIIDLLGVILQFIFQDRCLKLQQIPFYLCLISIVVSKISLSPWPQSRDFYSLPTPCKTRLHFNTSVFFLGLSVNIPIVSSWLIYGCLALTIFCFGLLSLVWIVCFNIIFMVQTRGLCTCKIV